MRATVRARLEDRLPGLRERLRDSVNAMSIWDLVRLRRFHDSKIAPIVEGWINEQAASIGKDIAESLDASLVEIEGETLVHGWTAREILITAAAGLFTVAPAGAIPLAGLAVTTGTSLFVFTTSAVSIPVLTGVLAIAVGTATVSGSLRRRAEDWRRERYRREVLAEIEARVCGPAAPGRPSLRDRLLGMVDAIARERLDKLAEVG